MKDEQKEMLEALSRDGVVRSAQASLFPLTGGVSSEIYLVSDGDRRFVVKRALAKLKVKDDWFADVSRNESEFDYIDYVAQFAPDNVPRVIRKGDGYFAMEYLGKGYKNWKNLMLEGNCDPEHARMAGMFLAKIHRKSWGDEVVARRFDNGSNFFELRIDPYILTTGKRHPQLKSLFDDEAGRLQRTRVCLMHGDFSPKNMLINGDRLVVLDCEVADYGDPIFDYSFALSHLLLKALFHSPSDIGASNLVQSFRKTYLAAFEFEDYERDLFTAKAGRLLAMLLLARVDGKSPVEYIQNDETKSFVRKFVYSQLTRGNQSPALKGTY